MTFRAYRPFFMGFLLIALVLTAGPEPARCMHETPTRDCIGPCIPDCNDVCSRRGYQSGACIMIVCCCEKV
ncbi:hypothetical protein VNO77_19449 [Canavalia gladiata]|uniref:LCR n=1 Tax=Canavalia gladiata TaxID=3824 RepID=A0AAN9LMN7_CANGL